ncbi:MAG: hypothetical protein methR_P3126 [Methyloprofundus sp.]|nr:MAG: hypothetical protein methR_P3126 [Methyloprofundus sp.]
MNKKLLLTLLAFSPLTVSAAAITAYSNDFDSAPVIAPGIIANWATPESSVQPVQGFTAAGFSGNFLTSFSHSTSASGNTAILTLNNLPTHTSISIDGLIAIIDSWDSNDGSLGATPDFFNILVDGSSIFQDTYNNASGTNNNLSLLADINGGKIHRGFSGAYLDQAFDLDNSLSIAHSSSSIQVVISGNGSGWQGGGDEAWGIDNFVLSLENNSSIPEPESIALLGLGLLGFSYTRRKHNSKPA